MRDRLREFMLLMGVATLLLAGLRAWEVRLENGAPADLRDAPSAVAAVPAEADTWMLFLEPPPPIAPKVPSYPMLLAGPLGMPGLSRPLELPAVGR